MLVCEDDDWWLDCIYIDRSIVDSVRSIVDSVVSCVVSV